MFFLNFQIIFWNTYKTELVENPIIKHISKPRVNLTYNCKYKYTSISFQPATIMNSPFSHPFTFVSWNTKHFEPRCLDEWDIINISQVIRKKHKWWRKYRDPEIVAKWKKELQELSFKNEVIDYAIAELKFYHILRHNTGGYFQAACDDHIYTGDRMISQELKIKFKTLVFDLLENVPENRKDWHPNSNNKVLDIVHPSLYPLMYGKTLVLKEGIVPLDLSMKILSSSNDLKPIKFNRDNIKRHKKKIAEFGISKRFQWLPALFYISSTGEVRIKSYINNLHPIINKDLYEPIAKIFEKCIPGLNATLSRGISKPYIRIKVPPYMNIYNKNEDSFKNESGEFDNEGYREWWNNRVPLPLKIKFEHIPSMKKFDVKGQQLKVITKLVNIELTPEDPYYEGGTWHIEGQINEDIVATIIYYYDSVNITDSRLSFRKAFNEPNYAQGDDVGMMIIYGLKDEDQTIKQIGDIECVEDRVIVFPNLYQHRVEPFQLADKTKNGHRKIICFFVCDPYNNSVVATDKVPPQQQEWWEQNIRNTTKLNSFPQEIFDKIVSYVDNPFPLKKAKKIREQLMKERSIVNVDDDHDDKLFGGTFSLCEH